MELQANGTKHISNGLEVNIAHDQYFYTKRTSYDPNLSSAAEYSPRPPAPPSTATVTIPESAQLATYQSIASSNYSDIHSQQQTAVTSSSEYANNCIAYSNVIFLPPTIASNNHRSNRVSDTTELVKSESSATSLAMETAEAHSYKYIVSSDPRFLNTFLRGCNTTGDDVKNVANISNHGTTSGYVEQPSHIINTVSSAAASTADDSNLILSNANHSNLYQAQGSYNQAHQQEQEQQQQQQHIPMHTEYLHEKHNNPEEIIMQTVANGQLYRHVHSVYFNHENTQNLSELTPTSISKPTAINSIEYAAQDTYHHTQNGNANDSHHSHSLSYEMHPNFGESICAADKVINESQPIIQNMNLNSVELLYDDYKDFKPLNVPENPVQTHHSEYTMLDSINRSDVLHDNVNATRHSLISANECSRLVQESSTKSNYQSHTSLSMMHKDQQRILLESTMSPLLAAVNDITAREKQFQSYLAQNKVENTKSDINTDYYPKCSNLNNSTQHNTDSGHSMHYNSTHENSTKSNELSHSVERSNGLSVVDDATDSVTTKDIFLANCENSHVSCVSPADEYVDINEMEFIETKNKHGSSEENVLMRRSQRKKTNKKNDELLVVDKHVPSRAYASLPTSYLYFGNVSDDLTKYTIFAKRDIPLRTKFGPFEGDLKTLDKNKLTTYKATNTKYPLLFVNQNSYLDVANENTSNWMRFVQLAPKYLDQNLLLYEFDSKLFFKSCQFIIPKRELRVGYSKEYAEKYKLPLLVPDEREKQKLYEKQNPWPCFECDKRFPTSEKLQIHLNVHDADKTIGGQSSASSKPTTATTMRNTPIKCNAANGMGSPVKSKHRLNTGEIRKRKLQLSKNSRITGPTVRYACCYCSKVFSKFLSYKKHTNAIHSVDIEHKRFTIDVEHKRFTIEQTKVNRDHKDKENENKSDDDSQNKTVPKKWFVCQSCQRYFATAERLEKHLLLRCNNNDSMSVQCHICLMQVQTPSALSMHIKTHNSKIMGIFKCPFCDDRYQSTLKLKAHVKTHTENGLYSCPHCKKEFRKYCSVRKHIQLNHSAVRFACHVCGKDFKSKYKLKEHCLRHSDVRQFLCADCGKQFKRKDKLREHILRVHVAKAMNSPRTNKSSKWTSKLLSAAIKTNHPVEQEMKISSSIIVEDTDNSLDSNSIHQMDYVSEIELNKPTTKSAKFQPKVPPTDYQRFIYKCHDCMLGFKRRGMLVNHMAKRHPNVRIDSVHELNLPILKTERCYYCQYCDKVYKSSSKRKAHILKYHPGQELPQSTRYKNDGNDNLNGPNLSFSQSIGSVTTHAQQCGWCHKQYASKTRLQQHQRKQHSTELQNEYDNNSSEYFQKHNLIHAHHHHHHQHYQYSRVHKQSEEQIHQINSYAMVNYSEVHQNEHHSQADHQLRFNSMGYEPENKLLKLSSAALEASLRDDFQFFHNNDNIVATKAIQSVHSIEEDVITDTTSLSKVNNFKVVGDEFVDTPTSSNCDLNPLPRLFEDIDCMPLKTTQFLSSNENSDCGATQVLRHANSLIKKSYL